MPKSLFTSQLQSLADLEAATQGLSRAWQISSGNDGAPDATQMRDMALQLAGFTGGLDQFHEHLAQQRIPATQETFALPDQLLVKTRPGSESDFFAIAEGTEEDDLTAMTDFFAVLADLEAAEGVLVEQDDTSLRDVPLWQYICEHYVCTCVTLEMPSIAAYGVLDEATEQGAYDYVRSLYLTPHAQLSVSPVDRQDDGSAEIYLLLSRR